MTLIAEDLLILLLDDAKGTVSMWGATNTALGGAVLAELAILGLVTVDEEMSFWRSAKVCAPRAQRPPTSTPCWPRPSSSSPRRPARPAPW